MSCRQPPRLMKNHPRRTPQIAGPPPWSAGGLGRVARKRRKRREVRALLGPCRVPSTSRATELNTTTSKMYPYKSSYEVPLTTWGLPAIFKGCLQGHPLPKGPSSPHIPYLPGPAHRPLAPGLRQDHRALPLPKPKEQPSSAPSSEIRASARSQDQPALGRTIWPEPRATGSPTSLCPYSSLPSASATPSAAPSPPSSPFSRGTQF